MKLTGTVVKLQHKNMNKWLDTVITDEMCVIMWISRKYGLSLGRMYPRDRTFPILMDIGGK